jgi:hypothetical protein
MATLLQMSPAVVLLTLVMGQLLWKNADSAVSQHRLTAVHVWNKNTFSIQMMMALVWLWSSRNDFIVQLKGSHATWL